MILSFRTSGLPIAIAAVFFTLTVYGQGSSAENQRNSGYFMVGASIGNFSNGAGTQFSDIYSNRSVTKNYSAGIGSRMLLIVGKYHEFTAKGHSIVTNVDVEGNADWKQKFYLAGLRIRGDDHPIYVDLLYVMTRAEEAITTVEPKVEELTKSYTTENKGLGAAIGVAIKFAGALHIFAEAEYTTMTDLGRNQYGRANPELGGMNLNAGLQLAF